MDNRSEVRDGTFVVFASSQTAWTYACLCSVMDHHRSLQYPEKTKMTYLLQSLEEAKRWITEHAGKLRGFDESPLAVGAINLLSLIQYPPF